MIQQILSWLGGFPVFSGLTAEYLGPGAGAAGLFCQGREVLWERKDILGRGHTRQKLVFTLAARGPDEAFLAALLDLEPQLETTAPKFGEDQKVLLERGRTVKNDGRGLLRMEARLTVEYTTKEE